MGEIIRYEHHGIWVCADEELVGTHREHCLCFRCKKLNLKDRQQNCPIANMLYALCVLTGLTTPVFECPEFMGKNKT
jgi:hypothetical protein